jgi:hypothetical protein
MRYEDLQEAHRATPFKPFDICVADGRRYPIPHPDFLLFLPTNQRTVIAATQEGTGAMLDVMMITALDFEGLGKSKKRKKAG